MEGAPHSRKEGFEGVLPSLPWFIGPTYHTLFSHKFICKKPLKTSNFVSTLPLPSIFFLLQVGQASSTSPPPLHVHGQAGTAALPASGLGPKAPSCVDRGGNHGTAAHGSEEAFGADSRHSYGGGGGSEVRGGRSHRWR
jgi:hypothetical protein